MVKKITIQEANNILGYEIVNLPEKEFILKFTDYEDTNFICNLCKDRKEILEIGTQFGHTTQNIAHFYPNSNITTVCISREINSECNLKYQEKELLPESEIGNVITNKNVTKNIMSSNMFFTINNKTYDAIFVDGDHSKYQVEIDTKNAFECINKNGIIIWHDIYNKDNSCSKCRCEPEFNDVREYLETLDKIIYKIENSWVGFYKCDQ